VNEVVARFDALLATQGYDELERLSRAQLAQHRFYLWHLYLIVALLRVGRREEAGRELDDLFSYKFNIADRAWPEVKAAFPEKFEGHYILSTMKPELGIEGGAQVRRKWTVPAPMADVPAFAAAMDKLIMECVPALPSLDRSGTLVTTFGSCFAANLARFLKAAGVDATNLLIEESINSPLANRSFLQAALDPAGSPQAGRVQSAFGADFLPRARMQLSGAQVIVLTLGVAPAFFHRGSDRFAFLEDCRALLATGEVYMRTPTVEEAKAVIADVFALVRALNPGARIYVSISPVPLLGTSELSSAVVADCISKTTLRAALHEVMGARGQANLIYWPSFEIVRWLGAHTTLSPFGIDDRQSRHVSNWLVELIVDRFARHLFGAAQGSPARTTSG